MSSERQKFIRAVVRAVYGQEPEMSRVSAFEWGVVDSWFEKELPLATVLQTVEQMERHPSIRYVKAAVEDEEFRRRRALTVG